MSRGWRGGANVQKEVGILAERGGARANRGGEERGCNGVEWRGGGCVFFYLSRLMLICNQKKKKIIISSHQLSLFWPLFVNERFMLREGGSRRCKEG